MIHLSNAIKDWPQSRIILLRQNMLIIVLQLDRESHEMLSPLMIIPRRLPRQVTIIPQHSSYFIPCSSGQSQDKTVYFRY